MRNVVERKPRNKGSLKRFYFLSFLLIWISFQAGADENIIDSELTVIRGDYKEVHYLVRDKSKDVRLQGTFTAKGGLNDDINFLIFTKDQFVRWYSNYSNKPILKLERKKEGKFDIPVVADETYYFVFDNFFSTVSNKQVKIQIKLITSE